MGWSKWPPVDPERIRQQWLDLLEKEAADNFAFYEPSCATCFHREGLHDGPDTDCRVEGCECREFVEITF